MPIREQQVTNRQHAIPQSIMSVEFKIIGDLTLKQFFFLLIFCGLAYVSF
ncbi:PrgI family protein, partial [Patescibacteria group bacterium]|nr:PrgI family protein [Patescibacteria group bacterium]MBU1970454.1 PrgI family protein [Patescibacteria group bacterium]